MGKLTVAQLAEILEKFQEAISHLQKEVKELRTECDSNKVTSSKLKIYVDELIATSNENIAMLDKKIEVSRRRDDPVLKKVESTDDSNMMTMTFVKPNPKLDR